MKIIDKMVVKRREEKYFLLGVDEEGVRYWLEQASWNCDWYWGLDMSKPLEAIVFLIQQLILIPINT